jgi:hypothetical protein
MSMYNYKQNRHIYLRLRPNDVDFHYRGGKCEPYPDRNP